MVNLCLFGCVSNINDGEKSKIDICDDYTTVAVFDDICELDRLSYKTEIMRTVRTATGVVSRTTLRWSSQCSKILERESVF